ncbi:hypothetical protein Hdeb2414_s0020g00555941 [Helianthus debilis subsp. tardiflorus]
MVSSSSLSALAVNHHGGCILHFMDYLLAREQIRRNGSGPLIHMHASITA